MRLCQAIRANRFFSHHWRRHDCMYQRRWTSRLVSAKRMRDFFEAEVTHFSTMPGEVLNLEYLLTAASCPHLAATCIYDEIPKCFAKRIRQIEMLDGWDQDSSLQQLHECYVTSFQEIRMAEIKSHDLASLAEFTKTVRRLKERQKPVLSLLGKAYFLTRPPCCWLLSSSTSHMPGSVWSVVGLRLDRSGSSLNVVASLTLCSISHVHFFFVLTLRFFNRLIQ